jgi:glycosyltransferase involved in cell wall biosynthesis
MNNSCSVVLPIHKIHPWINESLKSTALAMTDADELIVICDRLIESDIQHVVNLVNNLQIKRTIVKPSPGNGLVDALNYGIEISDSGLIARMDSDDVMKPMRLLFQKNFLNQNEQVGLIGGAIELISQEGRLESVKIYPTGPIKLKKLMNEGCFIAHPSVMYRKEVFYMAGRYRSLYPHAEDYDLWMRMMNFSDITNLDSILISYRQHPGQVSTEAREIQEESTKKLLAAYVK